MSEQPDLFDPSSTPPKADPAIEAKREAMQRVEDNANETWKERMYGCVVATAKTHARFTSDEVFDLAESCGYAHGTHDLRAFGTVMMRAAKAGVCRKADCAPINSRRASLHASPRAVWESLVK